MNLAHPKTRVQMWLTESGGQRQEGVQHRYSLARIERAKLGLRFLRERDLHAR